MRKTKRYKVILFTLVLFLIVSFIFFSQSKKPFQPNILFITIDSLRPDHLGCYGYKRDTSPNIDKLAKEGAIFTQAIAQGVITFNSVSSFISSTYPYMNLIDGENWYVYLNPNVNYLQDILKRHGYTTDLFSDHPFGIGRMIGIKNNFDSYVQIKTNKPKELTRLALKQLKKNRNQKFFLWVYYVGVHIPYSPSLPYSDIFYKDSLPRVEKYIPIATEYSVESFVVEPKHISIGFIPKAVAEDNITDVNYYIAKYDGKIRIIDEQIGLLLQELKKLDLDKKTLIILNADHGEELGERNIYFIHGYNVYDEAIKVPLIITYPNFIPKNKIIDHQVQLLDIVPTIMDILGIDRGYKNIEGISLKPYLLVEKDNIRQYAFTFCGSPVYLGCIRTEDWKLIYIDREKIKKIPGLSQRYGDYFLNDYELYNLKKDPLETHNLINEEKEIFENLKQKLNVHTTKSKQVFKDFIKDEPFGPLDEIEKERLRSLGYLQ